VAGVDARRVSLSSFAPRKKPFRGAKGDLTLTPAHVTRETRNLNLRQEARERRIISNVKPFIETLRVTNPARQSRASSREASLAWGRATVTAKRRQRDQTLRD